MVFWAPSYFPFQVALSPIPNERCSEVSQPSRHAYRFKERLDSEAPTAGRSIKKRCWTKKQELRRYLWTRTGLLLRNSLSYHIPEDIYSRSHIICHISIIWLPTGPSYGFPLAHEDDLRLPPQRARKAGLHLPCGGSAALGRVRDMAGF